MVWGATWLSRVPAAALPSSRPLMLLRLRLLSIEVMLEEEVVRERARRVIPADGTETGREKKTTTDVNIPLAQHRDQSGSGNT